MAVSCKFHNIYIIVAHIHIAFILHRANENIIMFLFILATENTSTACRTIIYSRGIFHRDVYSVTFSRCI